jgi:hypothetical protein
MIIVDHCHFNSIRENNFKTLFKHFSIFKEIMLNVKYMSLLVGAKKSTRNS